MIVKSGRNLIATTTITDNLTKFKFFLEKSDGSDISFMTTPDMELGNRTRIETSNAVASSVPSDPGDNTLYVSYDSTNLQLKFTAFIKGAAGTTEGIYAAAGLIYNGETLFSRVTFRETTISNGSTYKMEYTIYF